MLLRPAGDRARAGDHLAVVEDEDRHLVGAAQPLHLGPVLVAAAPGPWHQPVAAHHLQLVGVAGRVESLARLRARMREGRSARLLSTGVEQHRAENPSVERASTGCYDRRTIVEVATRDLRNKTADLLKRVEAGESMVITVRGKPVADLVPHNTGPRWLTPSDILAIREIADRDHTFGADLQRLKEGTTDELGPTW